MSIVDFMSDTEIFNLNLVKLVKYIERSKIGFKLRGFSQRNFDDKPAAVAVKGVGAFLASLNKAEEPKPEPEVPKENVPATDSQPVTSSPIFLVDEFLRSLVNPISFLVFPMA